MEQLVDKHESLTERIDRLNDHAMQLLNTDIHQTMSLANEALELSESDQANPYLKGAAHARLVLGAAHYRHTNHHEALRLSQQALEVCEHLGELRSLTFGLNTIGATYITLGAYDKALETHMRSLQIRESIGDDHGTATSFMNVGNVYFLLGDYARALDCYIKSLNLRTRIDDKTGIGTSLANIANVYSSMGDSDQALEYLLQSASIKETTGNKQGLGQTFSDVAAEYLKREELPSALSYAHRSYDVSVEIGNKIGQAAAMHMIAQCEEKSGRTELALNYYRRALEMRKSIGYHKGEIESGIAMALLMCSIGDAIEAETVLNDALLMAEEAKSKPLIFEACQALSRCSELQNDFVKALEYFRRFHGVKEELFNENSAQRTKSLQVLHKVEQARHEAEIYRVRSVELSDANEEIARQAEALQQSNDELLLRDHEKDELLAIVAHDLKNPLAGIIINTSNIQRNQERMSSEEIFDQVRRIEQTAKRMKEITINLLDIHAIESSRIQLKCERINLCECAHQVIERIESRAQEKNISLHVLLESMVIYATADLNATLQVLENLVSNAIKYSPKHTTVVLRCRKSTSGHAVMEVRDEGPGIPEGERDKLFKKFSRLSTRPTAGEESTGLGLSIVKKLVEGMNGKVWYEDAEGGGSKFIVSLPSN